MSSDTSKDITWCFGIQEDVHNAIKNIDKGLFPQAFARLSLIIAR
jgi:hypothetical protein